MCSFIKELIEAAKKGGGLVKYHFPKTKDGKPLFEKGFAHVPDSPGLGIELNEDVLKQHLDPDNKNYFAPTPEWDSARSWDRLWS